MSLRTAIIGGQPFPCRTWYSIKCGRSSLISHTYLRSLLGETAAAVADDDALSSPPYVAISDSFAGLVREGLVSEHRGRLAAARGKRLFIRRTDTQTDTETAEETAMLADIDEIILCTGYRPDLDFLDESILSSLQHQPEDSFSPLLLCREMLHPAQPGLFFVGMYRGPYFAAMELQAVWPPLFSSLLFLCA